LGETGAGAGGAETGVAAAPGDGAEWHPGNIIIEIASGTDILRRMRVRLSWWLVEPGNRVRNITAIPIRCRDRRSLSVIRRQLSFPAPTSIFLRQQG